MLPRCWYSKLKILYWVPGTIFSMVLSHTALKMFFFLSHKDTLILKVGLFETLRLKTVLSFLNTELYI